MTANTMMDVELTIEQLAGRAEGLLGHTEVVSRGADKSITRTNYRDVLGKARQLARGLVAAGLEKGERVGTLMWNHAEHLEAYFGIPLAGGVIHTLNLRLHPDDIAYVATDAGDRFLLVDESLLPLFEKFREKVKLERVWVVGAKGSVATPLEDYRSLLKSGEGERALPVLSERDPLGMCYSSGTTGQPKGVTYTHRSTVLHTLAVALPDCLRLSREDTLLVVVPMFHVNAWGLPYACAMVGAKQVHPGPHLDAVSLLDLMEQEKVTIAAGVPTIWMAIREALEANPGRWKLQPNASMVVGGSAAPEDLIRAFDKLGLRLLHAWGMTETSPVALVSRLPPAAKERSEDAQYALRAKQGIPVPLVDVRLRTEDGASVPADGKTSGEIIVRGPWIAAHYHHDVDPARWTKDGFFRTGDVATVDDDGFFQLTDRVADMIKSGGEWISSVALENALMGHPAVREAAVVAAPHPKWSERPLAAVVLKPGVQATPEELKAFLAPKFAKFWLPEAFVFVDAIPRTSAGKFKKSELRERFKNHQW